MPGGTRVNARGPSPRALRTAVEDAIHAPVPRHRRRSRRRRLLGPLGIGIVAFIGIATIVAGNGAAPPSTAGAVADATDKVPAATKRGQPARRTSLRSPPNLPGRPRPRPWTSPPPSSRTRATRHPSRTLTGYRWPIANARLTLPFGKTPWGGWLVDGEKFHDGIDLATFCGDKVVAAHDGVVLAAGRRYDDHMGWIGDLSKYKARLDAKKLWVTLPIVVVIDDGNGYRSVYAHFGKEVVKKGQEVKAGDLLGYEGRTGRASGCHLHYGIFSPSETDQYVMDPVAAKRMKLPGVEIARIDPQLVLPERSTIEADEVDPSRSRAPARRPDAVRRRRRRSDSARRRTRRASCGAGPLSSASRPRGPRTGSARTESQALAGIRQRRSVPAMTPTRAAERISMGDTVRRATVPDAVNDRRRRIADAFEAGATAAGIAAR